MIQLFSVFSDWAVVILRVAVGLIFLAHGLEKVKSLKNTQAWFSSIGFKPGVFWGSLVTFLEFFGGIALISGFLVQPIAFLLTLEMMVATFWKLRLKQKLIGGYEFDLLLIAALLILAVSGSNAYSIDSYFGLYLF